MPGGAFRVCLGTTGWCCGRSGPSPRVRGADEAPKVPVRLFGAIPADAGSRYAKTLKEPQVRGHPRGCGEQARRRRTQPPPGGPSPRVRGAIRLGHHHGEAEGAIPAGAGSSGCGPATPSTCRGHPRGCGEQTRSRLSADSPMGPSPRVRGAARHARQRERQPGAIPAGAGSSPPPGSRSPSGRGHPRGCGEQDDHASHLGQSQGPSPRVRGAGVAPRAGRARGGAIPAGAGSSRAAVPPATRPRGHPRGCGEQGECPVGDDPREGPSPRVRGADRDRGPGAVLPGAIPAGAGSRPSTAC